MNFVRDFTDGAVGKQPRDWLGHLIIATLWGFLGAALIILAALIYIALAPAPAHARGDGWADTDPKMRQWFQSLMQPDNPAVSCCGEADAYEADDYAIEGDHYIAIITDERGDTFRNGVTRPHIEPGTRISVPNIKIKWDQSNPTGHGYIFIGGGGTLYCYCPPPGV